ncbi:TfoX/Sxy family protein [Undibacterium sp. Ji42W]|uniref:TfoX/Sxy family protein n=1 Tax=Undibacterium sp. Ji42W TaxID=3413039 RepID=UPI003BF081DD
MARDKGLEELINNDLESEQEISAKAMFGGWAWLSGGHLVCGAREDGMLVRLGKGHENWALQLEGVVPMMSRGRLMAGWVRADARAFGDDEIRHNLMSAALAFVRTLPAKK